MRHLFWITPVLIGLALSCGGSGGGAGLNSAQHVTGTVYAANGTDPVAGATVYIPNSSSSKISLVRHARTRVRALTSEDNTTCDDPAEASCGSTCSGANGTFTMDTSGCTGRETTLKIIKGIFRKTVTMNCSGDTCEISKADCTFDADATGTDATKMAVVTGSWDKMEDVLAKLGYGTVGDDGHLVSGTEKFTIFGASTLFDGEHDLSQYDIIFINCGAGESPLYTDAIKTSISDYVTNGGKLYVTDLAYDYVEQIFPQVMKFENDPDSDSTSGDMNEAELGTSGLTVDAAVNNTTMMSWLGGVTVNTGWDFVDDASCESSTIHVNAKTGALNDNGTIPVGDFLSGWAEMNSAHTDQSPTIWIQGDIMSLATRPLTVSMDIGTHGGKVLYSSYHTSESCPSTGFWPQERVLQYLVFEM
ncbi:MAG: hypothetical protein V1798_04465 [Pseudomonadota bacterium]